MTSMRLSGGSPKVIPLARCVVAGVQHLCRLEALPLMHSSGLWHRPRTWIRNRTINFSHKTWCFILDDPVLGAAMREKLVHGQLAMC